MSVLILQSIYDLNKHIKIHSIYLVLVNSIAAIRTKRSVWNNITNNILLDVFVIFVWLGMAGLEKKWNISQE